MNDNSVKRQFLQTITPHGAYPGVTFNVGSKTLPVPLTTNIEVITFAAYWFSRMRALIHSADAKVVRWGNLTKRADDTYSSYEYETDKILNVMPIDTYLALPTRSMLDNDATESSDRVSPLSFVQPTVQTAAQWRVAIRSGAEKPAKVAVNNLTVVGGGRYPLSDTVGPANYKRFLNGLLGYWESLIQCVEQTKNYPLPVPGGVPGEKFGDVQKASRFWSLIARIEAYIEASGEVESDQWTWGDWARNAGVATKDAAREIVVTGANAAGKVAAWTADTAGEAYGNFWGAFLSNVGLWGIGFVAVYIYFH